MTRNDLEEEIHKFESLGSFAGGDCVEEMLFYLHDHSSQPWSRCVQSSQSFLCIWYTFANSMYGLDLEVQTLGLEIFPRPWPKVAIPCLVIVIVRDGERIIHPGSNDQMSMSRPNRDASSLWFTGPGYSPLFPLFQVFRGQSLRHR
jgi:hypothetical protein